MHSSKLLLWAITSSLAGFLFGFDTVVISGAEKQIQDLWSLSGSMHGWAMSAALWGTVLGSLLGGIPTSKWGRKKTLISIGILYLLSAIGSALANEVYFFIFARFIGGIGVGVSTIAAPLYISEIAPAKDRGKLAGMFQFNIVFGILVAYLSNYIINANVSPDSAWRWMLGIEALPAAIYTFMAFTLPESPRWLISQAGRKDEGKSIFALLNPNMNNEQLDQWVLSVQSSQSDPKVKTPFFSSKLSIPIFLAFLIAFFNQLSGINVILYFAPRLLDLAGVNDALMASISLGVTNLIFTFVGLYLIDRLGRKTLLLIGSFGYIISLGVCAYAFLSASEFKVVSSAIDVISSAQKVIQIEDKSRYMTPQDEQLAMDAYQQAKVQLSQDSQLSSYSGKAITWNGKEDVQNTLQIANEVKAESSKALGALSSLVLICIIGFIAAHALGQGAVIWVFISEIFPNANRASGQALGSFTHWIFAATLTFVFPIAIKSFDAGIMFAFFAFMMVLQLVWVVIMVPETKGVSLEDMQKKLGMAQ
jgi:MFS family permease